MSPPWLAQCFGAVEVACSGFPVSCCHDCRFAHCGPCTEALEGACIECGEPLEAVPPASLLHAAAGSRSRTST